MVNRERLIAQFIHMVETDSVTGNEDKMRDLLIEEFSKRGLSAIEDNAGKILGGSSGNLLVKIPGTLNKPAILFGAHMDTVGPGKGVQVIIGDDGVIRSAGDTILGSDDKSGIAALLEAVDILRENKIDHPPLELLFTVGEEHGLDGAKLLDYSKLAAKIGYTLDGGGAPGTIIINSPCQNEIKYMVYGKPAHAGINPEDGVNAIKVAAAALAKMPCGRVDDETTCNFGIINGGTARNVVAGYCYIKGETRSLNRAKLDALTAKLENIFYTEVEKHGAQAKVRVEFLYPEVNLDSNEQVVNLAQKAAENIGLNPNLASTGGGSDASIINGRGIRCANLGIGMTDVHTTDESIKVADLINNARLVVAIIQEASRE
ncbi:MAG: M20/M25/M40 family metallo-hydrolase [Syntrophomonadaceae bacterium]|nr:M20/M25/M40 family metallo-hydrolase [Syntrophomonadaceae bacterium]MDD3888488.1 M20/M25/M40 family metallo-hydrolase [Syntrophomonadaceae bacterium]MDD4548728.1 M20/M25/M40 family metallo-hydrolase [Syntrophomonadaceae bacterium]